MKHFLPLLFALLTTPLWSQTGNGVVILTDASHTFTPTTVDSTTSFSFQLVNEVGVTQTVFFGALDAPFALDDNAPVEIPSLDTIDVTVNFTPTDLGTFTDTLSFVGSVFGSSELILSGDGIQVVLEWAPSTLGFDTTAIGQTNSQTIALTSSGNGDASITDIAFSSPIFSIDSANSAFTIAEGSTENLTVVYAPINAGAVNETMTLSTNDPNNPSITIDLDAIAISEVSGEICDITWTMGNSPYTFTGEVIIPTGCYLSIEPGVEIIGNNHGLSVYGSLSCLGNADNPISLNVGQFKTHTALENCTLEYCHVIETRQEYNTPFDSRSLLNEIDSSLIFTLNQLQTSSATSIALQAACNCEFINGFQNESDILGKYVEDFEDGLGQGWTNGGNVGSWSTSDGHYYIHYNSGSSGTYPTHYVYSPVFEFSDGHYPTNISWNQWMDWWDGCNDYARVHVNFNNQGWTEVQYFNCDYDANQNSTYSKNLNSYFDITQINSLQVRWTTRFRYYGTNRIDNFTLTTNTYPGQDLPLASAYSHQFSTGGIRMSSSTFEGDLSILADSKVRIELIDTEFKDSNLNDGISIHADECELSIINSEISGHGRCGLNLFCDSSVVSATNSNISFNSEKGVFCDGRLELDATETDVNNNGQDGIEAGASSDLALYGVRIQDNGGRGVAVLDGASLDLDYVLIDDNGGRGIDMGANGQLNADYLRICDSGEEGIYSASSSNISHSNIGFNTGTATVFTGNNFHTLDNSILWGNNTELYKQIDLEGGILSASYSLIQGLSTYGVGGAGQYSLGEGLLETDPLLADEDMHLEVYSPCVDGGQPWTQDEYMPYGLGGVRADMGMYGGPENAYWGGSALPNGASAIASVSDSPQDQGNTVGLTFSGSYYDNSDLVNNVTHYAFWRHYDPTGQPVASLADGNWELLGTMPSQSFSGYAYQAATLGNTNDTGPFTSCYTVVAHTDDPDTYWYSNVMCGESVDNLAPNAPDLNGMPLEEGGAQISWADPDVEDYGYTRILGDNGFEAEISADTLVVDAAALAGSTVTYTATHFDVNGNESDPADVTLVIGEAFDVIPLNTGWNLISLDREPENADLATVFADLVPGNLEYVTGFDAGVSFYDPNGPSFLNTLSSLTSGFGYWVKVAADDTLRSAGTPLGGGYLPTLDAGWNLVAYTADGPLAPETFFADLIADGDLDYVTGFDAGVQVFDPNGLPFLNSLTQLRNGYGYWVKTASDFAGMELADGVRAMPNPNYVVLNGTSNLGAYAGQVVDVVTDRGDVVAQLPILEGGHLMTTAVYGAGLGEGGLADGTPLYLEFAGQRTDAVAAWTGDMAHIKLDVALEVAFSVFPNPTTDRTDLRWEQLEASLVTVELFDAQGRRVANENLGSHLPGAQQATIAVGQLAPGAYTLRLLVDGRTTHQSALTRAE